MIRRWLSIATVTLCVVGAACGGRDSGTSSEEDDATVADAGAAPTEATGTDEPAEEPADDAATGDTTAEAPTEDTTSEDVAADDTAADDTATDDTAAEEPAELLPGQFGTMAAPVCGPGDASGSTDQGVSDESITIGTLSDAGNTLIPGLLQEMFDAADGFVTWCNAAGGINGRQIELIKRDTKLLEAQERIAEACVEDFMLVGGAAGLDGTIVEPREACGLPQFPAFANDPLAIEADLQISLYTVSPDKFQAGMYQLAATAYPEAAANYGLLAADTRGSATPTTERIPQAIAPLGFTTVYTNTTPAPPATVDNWRPFLEPAVADGVQAFEFRQTAEQVVAAMNNFADVGFAPALMFGNPSLYTPALIEGNDAIGDDLEFLVGIYIQPFESAPDNAPMQQFLDIMDAAVPGWSDSPRALAVNAFAEWLLWAQAASECGSDLTRDCVLANAGGVTGFDAGGLTAPVDVVDGLAAPGTGPSCVAMVRATADGFVYDEALTEPNTGIYNCDASFLVDAPR